jgi:vitamin B12 transporter
MSSSALRLSLFPAALVLALIALPAGAQPVASSAPPVIEVTVTRTDAHPGQPPKAPGVAGSVLARDRLLGPGATAASALREAPGMQITEVGGLGAPATASIRGATAAQTPVYVGGVRVNDEVGGAANLADIPLFLMERVEVYRSHAPLAADRLGVGGAIFFEPRRPRGNHVSVGSEVGSFGQRSAWLYAEDGGDTHGVLAGVKLTASQNDYPFFNDQGTLFAPGDDRKDRLRNADTSLTSAWIRAERRLGTANLGLLYNHTDREQGAPKLALVPTREARTRFSRDLVALTSTLPVLAWHGGLRLMAAAARAVTEVKDPLRELGLLTSETLLPGARVEQRTRADQQVTDNFGLVEQLSISSEQLARSERHEHGLQTSVVAKRMLTRAALGGRLIWSDAASSDAMVTLSCFDTSDADLGFCSRAQPAGRVGAVYAPADWELYGNLGRYVRLPTLGEAYGVSLLVRGNPRLRPETGSSAEVGSRWQWLREGRRVLWVDLSLFTRFADDLINYVRTAQGYLTPRNSSSAVFKGSELAVGGEPLDWLELEGSASALDPRDTSGDRVANNDILPFQSRMKLVSVATIKQRWPGRWIDSARLTARWVYQSNRYSDPAGLGVIPQQQWTDLEATLVFLDELITLRGRAGNVFDARRFDVVGFPLPGRSAFLSMEARW